MPKRLYQVSVTPQYGERSTACVLAPSEAAAQKRALGDDVRVTPQGEGRFRVADRRDKTRFTIAEIFVRRGCDCVLDSD